MNVQLLSYFILNFVIQYIMVEYTHLLCGIILRICAGIIIIIIYTVMYSSTCIIYTVMYSSTCIYMYALYMYIHSMSIGLFL